MCLTLAHMHRLIIMSHNVVIDIMKNVTGSKIGKQLAFHSDQMSKVTVCTSIPAQTQELLSSLCRNPISIWEIAGGYMQRYNFTS
jgi:hypothetical protein